MAIVHFVKSKRTQTVGGLNAVINYCCKDAKVDYQGRPLISGINCVPQCALQEFMNTKRLHHSTRGRMYYHMVQSFRPDDPVTPERAHEIALKLAEQIPGFEIVVATHTDRDHIHSHFVINSVSCDTGLKYHSNRDSLEQLWKASDELCLQYGLSVVKPKKKQQQKERTMSDREYRAYAKGDSWKMNLEINIDECMTLARDREHFIRLMEYSGYEVKWTADRKNITYTTPDGHKCRDSKLNGLKYHKEVMEYEFRIRREICCRNAGSAARDDLKSGIGAAHRRRHGTELEGDDRLAEMQIKTLGEIQEYLDTLTTEKQLLLYMDRQLEILQQDGQASREAMEQYRQTLMREAQNTTSTMQDTVKSLERQVGKMSEEFGNAILREQERMKNTSKKLFWISMIPSLILVVWELTRHIWLLG